MYVHTCSNHIYLHTSSHYLHMLQFYICIYTYKSHSVIHIQISYFYMHTTIYL
ncbi:hypothetical protein Hanom_Chr09g00860081 [Helianthus anomalus]